MAQAFNLEQLKLKSEEMIQRGLCGTEEDEMAGKPGPIGWVIHVLQEYYNAMDAGKEWNDADLTHEEFLKVAEQTANLFQYIFDNEKIDGRNIVTFLGATGTGKSTTIAVLSGAQVAQEEVPSDAIDFFTKKPIVCKEYRVQGKEYQDTIGFNPAVSATFLPRYCGKVFEGEDEVDMWDFPGFEDTRSRAINLGLAEGYKHMVRKAKRCHVVLTSSAKIMDKAEIRKVPQMAMLMVPGEANRNQKFFLSLNFTVQENMMIPFQAVCQHLDDVAKVHYSLMDLSRWPDSREMFKENLLAFIKSPGTAIVMDGECDYVQILQPKDITIYKTHLNARLRDDPSFAEKVMIYIGLPQLKEAVAALRTSVKTKELGAFFEKQSSAHLGTVAEKIKEVSNMFKEHTERVNNATECIQEKMDQDSAGSQEQIVFASHDDVDKRLSKLMVWKDIDIMTPVLEIEANGILDIALDEIKEEVLIHLKQVLEVLTGDLHKMISGMADNNVENPSWAVLKASLTLIIDEVRSMLTDVDKLHQGKGLQVWKTSDYKGVVDTISTIMMVGGAAMEFIPGVGTVAGTALIAVGGLVKLVAMISTKVMDWQAAKEKKQVDEFADTVGDLLEVIKQHSRSLKVFFIGINSRQQRAQKAMYGMEVDKERVRKMCIGDEKDVAAV